MARPRVGKSRVLQENVTLSIHIFQSIHEFHNKSSISNPSRERSNSIARDPIPEDVRLWNHEETRRKRTEG